MSQFIVSFRTISMSIIFKSTMFNICTYPYTMISLLFIIFLLFHAFIEIIKSPSSIPVTHAGEVRPHEHANITGYIKKKTLFCDGVSLKKSYRK